MSLILIAIPQLPIAVWAFKQEMYYLCALAIMLTVGIIGMVYLVIQKEKQ